ncbi:MAG: hypothetical protein H6720_17690 [Sandaracinus sp.]|nr:hypothetical protein [Myxococcales bacterium]MCB9602155.1 hypothetical protein [Sandaracinus sp.]MCB9625534.1 hypothetical protein [Sandaracinus sp.]
MTRLQSLSLLLGVVVLQACGDSCPAERLPTLFRGEDHLLVGRAGDYYRDSSDDAQIWIDREYDPETGEWTGRFEFSIGSFCTLRLRAFDSCELDAGAVSAQIEEPCTWTTRDGETASWRPQTYHVWWGPDELDIDVVGEVTYTAPDGSVVMGDASYLYLGEPPY